MIILYVEDNADDVLFFTRSLKKIHPAGQCRVVTSFHDSKCYLVGEGTYKDRKQYPFPTLVIATAKLPEGKGLDVLRWAHSRPELSRLPFCIFDDMPEHLREPLPDPTRQRYFEKPSSLREWPLILQQILTWSETCR